MRLRSSFSPIESLRKPISLGRSSFRMTRPGVVSMNLPSLFRWTFAL